MTCGPPPAPRRPAPASAAASPPARARPPAAAPRARSRAPAPASPAWFEGGQTPIHVRVPKLRGFKRRDRIDYQVVNVGRISGYAEAGRFGGDAREPRPAHRERRGPRAAGLVSHADRPVKVLGAGEVSVRCSCRRRLHGQRAHQDRGRGGLRPGPRAGHLQGGRPQRPRWPSRPPPSPSTGRAGQPRPPSRTAEDDSQATE